MQILFIAVGAFARLIPHVPNFTPIGALALFGAAYGSRRSAILVPLAALMLSDLIIGGHPTWPYVYGAFVLIALAGMAVFRNGVTVPRLIGASLGASGILFLVSNFGVWAVRDFYPKTAEGMLTAYTMALPFLRGNLLGDLFFVGVMFGGYELARRWLRTPAQKLAPSGQ